MISVPSPIACRARPAYGPIGMSESPISTPCLGVCAVSGAHNLCIGCGRTLKEIASWTRLSEPERLAIMAQLPARLAALPELK